MIRSASLTPASSNGETPSSPPAFLSTARSLRLVLSLGSGTHVFVFSSGGGVFVQAHESVVVPPRTQEFAINASNYRHWDEAVRLYVDDCLKGTEGPREKEFNMRWIAARSPRMPIASSCAAAIYLYPARRRGGDMARAGCGWSTRPIPIAFIIEQAGGAATDVDRPHSAI